MRSKAPSLPENGVLGNYRIELADNATLQALRERRSRLVRTHAVNRAVGGQQDPYDCATHATEHRADSGWQGSTTNIQAEGCRAWFVYSCANRGSHTSTRSSHDEGVAQTVFVFHEYYTENVLLLNTLFASRLPVRDRCIGDAREESGMFLRGHFDHLNLLSRPQRTEIRPGCLRCLIGLSQRSTG